ncbi:MAG: S58 family peptidase [Gemmatimonadales bacterium]|nr:MAG: S58 family peptidase [Gemmatimonadales bacterium]
MNRSRVLAALPLVLLPLLLAMSVLPPTHPDDPDRPRARDLGIQVGIFQPGPLNAITDVAGVRVGQTTVSDGERVNTGVTAILPHGGNPFRSRVPAAIHVGNGFGKLVGVTQVRELGELETPILLTCTLCVWQAADAMAAWMLEREGMGNVASINPVVGETNDAGLNDIRSRPIEARHVVEALESASDGAVEEGSVGAGTGTRAFGWKGGIGTSSRVLPEDQGGWTVGVLVQSNYGGILTVDGAPVGQELGQYSFRGSVESGDDAGEARPGDEGDPGAGSIMIVIATDAPLSDRNLERLASRAMLGLARTGSFAGNGSGDYIIAFSTADEVRREGGALPTVADLPNARTSALFQGVVEATEEAILNSIFRATTTSGMGRNVEALPLEETLDVLRRHGVIDPESP